MVTPQAPPPPPGPAPPLVAPQASTSKGSQWTPEGSDWAKQASHNFMLQWALQAQQPSTPQLHADALQASQLAYSKQTNAAPQSGTHVTFAEAKAAAQAAADAHASRRQRAEVARHVAEEVHPSAAVPKTGSHSRGAMADELRQKLAMKLEKVKAKGIHLELGPHGKKILADKASKEPDTMDSPREAAPCKRAHDGDMGDDDDSDAQRRQHWKAQMKVLVQKDTPEFLARCKEEERESPVPASRKPNAPAASSSSSAPKAAPGNPYMQRLLKKADERLLKYEQAADELAKAYEQTQDRGICASMYIYIYIYIHIYVYIYIYICRLICRLIISTTLSLKFAFSGL